MDNMEINTVFKVVSAKSMHLMQLLEAVNAIGVSGSHARGTVDAQSDIDLCVFTDQEIPHAQVRESAYQKLGFGEAIYFDVDFETSRGDGFKVDGIRCDFNWMSAPQVREFLKRLNTDFETAEYLPGGLLQVKEILDPDGVIAHLKASIPVYSEERAQYRIKKAIDAVHFSWYQLGWLEKAVVREDLLLFLKYQVLALDSIIRILFALNKTWLAYEKGLIKLVGNFKDVPVDIGSKLEAIILPQNEHQDLKIVYNHLKVLLADIVQVALERYPGLDLPQKWE